MVGKIYVNGVIGDDCTLLDVIRQVKSFKNLSELEVHIDSVGGSVDNGMAIFNYLRNLQIPITTIATQAYSIAASIFMAGDTRIVQEGEARILIHMPWAQVAGQAERLESVAEELRKIENDFIDFYSLYTSIDKNSIRTMLQNETFLSSEEALDLGFATEVQVPLKAVAFYNEINTKTKIKMTKTEELIQAIKGLFSIYSAEDKVEIKALIVQDANGVEINFVELTEGDEPSVGDKAEVDGKPADGEFVSTDGSTWVFSDGTLSEIKPAEEPEEEPVVEEAAETVAQEEVIEDGEVIEEEEVVAEEVPQITLESIMALLSELQTKIETKLENSNSELKSELSELKKIIGSEELEVKAQLPKPNTKTNSNTLTDILRGTNKK